VPAIQPKVAKLDLYQRTPPWIVPRRDRAISRFERSVFRNVPGVQAAIRGSIYALRELMVLGFMHPKWMTPIQRLARKNLRAQVPDPSLRARLTPNYQLGCKRILISDDYLPSLSQPNVEVIAEGIREIGAQAITAADGTERPADAIIFGTGFQVTSPPAAQHLRGRAGQTLAESWSGSPKAYLGTTFAGFPNLFMLLGPNTGLGHTSVVFMIECQIAHVLRALEYMERQRIAELEPRPEAQAAFVAELDARLGPTVWNSGGCASWYLDATGRNSTLWPGTTWAFKRRVERFSPEKYLLSSGDADR
jgi:cation diffusion facilitator CzcD-associated flavoprotein CzcO